MIKFATALCLISEAALAQDTVNTYEPETTNVGPYGIEWVQSQTSKEVRLRFDENSTKRDNILVSNNNSAFWTVDRLSMSGWFLKPETPLDGCVRRPTIVQGKTEKRDWWDIHREKDGIYDEIRRRMNLQGDYDQCRQTVAAKFTALAKRDRREDATLDSELLDEQTYLNPRIT